MTKIPQILALLVAAGFPTLASAQTNIITLGAAVQLTGAQANTGRYYKDAYQLAVDKINEKGGITVGGKKYNFALKVLDSQSDVNLGVRLYTQLVTSDKVNFLLGPFSSNDALDDSSVAEKYQIPMVQGGGASTQIFSRGYKYIFGTLPAADNYFFSTIEMLKTLNPKPQTVALVAADDSFDVGVANGTRPLLQKAGFTLVVDEKFRDLNGEFNSVLSLIKSKNPDVVLWTGHDADALNFIRQSKALNASAKYLSSYTVGVPTPDFRKALGQDAEYAFGMTAWLPDASLKDRWFGDAAAFAKEYSAKFGYDPDYHAASAAADVETFAVALEKAGTIDPAKVRDAIAAASFDSLYAHVAFGASGQVDLPQVVVQIKGGQVAPIFATDYIQKPTYPVPTWDQRK